jgi:hypothetical protein
MKKFVLAFIFGLSIFSGAVYAYSTCDWDCATLQTTYSPIYNATTDVFDLRVRINCSAGDILDSCGAIDIQLTLYKYIGPPYLQWIPIQTRLRNVAAGVACGSYTTANSLLVGLKAQYGTGLYSWDCSVYKNNVKFCDDSSVFTIN